MNINEKEIPLKATNNAAYNVVNGVTYFKLKSGFPGDITKNCGLLGEEIDKNFFFLRGNDIKDIKFDENRNLVITRVNDEYEPLIVNIPTEEVEPIEIEYPTFDFNKETGIFTIVYPDGTIKELDGFLIEKEPEEKPVEFKLSTDNSIIGDGSVYNPLRVAKMDRTGTYAPVEDYIDLTVGSYKNKVNTLEKLKEKGNGYRFISKEIIDNFGCLYPFSAIELINKRLADKNSPWRVPTKQDWDELLNSLECAEDRDHTSNSIGWAGKLSGAGLKSTKLWDKYENAANEIPTDGQNIVNLSIYPIGYTSDRITTTNANDNDIEEFGRNAGMWANTLAADGKAYTKQFSYKSAQVYQDTCGKGAKMSIRLCKEFEDNNYEKVEEILGLPYPTELVRGIHNDMPYIKIWTKINFYDTDTALGGVRSDEWLEKTNNEGGVKVVYFINEWDGREWHKKLMNNGDSVVILNYEENGEPKLSLHEWRVNNEELIDITTTVKQYLLPIISGVQDTIISKINLVNENASNERIRIENKLDNEINIRKIDDDKIKADFNESIANVHNIVEEINTNLSDRITNEANNVKQIKSELDNKIELNFNNIANNLTEIETLKKEDVLITSNISEVRLKLEEVGNVLTEKIKDETNNRKIADEELRNHIEDNFYNKENIDEKIATILNQGEITLESYITKNSFDEKLYGNIDDDKNKTIREIASEEVSKVVDNAPEAFDTIKEIADWIAKDEEGVAALVNRIAVLEEHIANMEKFIIDVLENRLKGTDLEIKVERQGDDIKLGFADDAIFGYISNN